MAFSTDQFARQLVIESLFYDEEYGALGNISLIDRQTLRERYLASFDPERNSYLIEEAIEWEDLDADEDGEIDYALAVDGKEHGCFDNPEAAADELLSLAKQHDLSPSFMILFEDDEG